MEPYFRNKLFANVLFNAGRIYTPRIYGLLGSPMRLTNVQVLSSRFKNHQDVDPMGSAYFTWYFYNETKRETLNIPTRIYGNCQIRINSFCCQISASERLFLCFLTCIRVNVQCPHISFTRTKIYMLANNRNTCVLLCFF